MPWGGTGVPVALRDPVFAEVLCHRVSAVQRLFSGNGLSIRGLLASSCERARRSLGLLDLVVKAPNEQQASTTPAVDVAMATTLRRYSNRGLRTHIRELNAFPRPFQLVVPADSFAAPYVSRPGQPSPVAVRVSDSLGRIVAQFAGLFPRKVCVIGGVALISDRVGRCSRSAGLSG